MSYTPLPGINKPLSLSEEKAAKLAERSEHKKSLLMAKAPQPEMDIGLNPFMAQEMRDAAALDYALKESLYAKREREENSWVSDAGLDTRKGQVGQLGASAASGTTRLVGDTASASFTAMGNRYLSEVSEEEINAHNIEQDYLKKLKELTAAEVTIGERLLRRQITEEKAQSLRAEVEAQRAALKAPDPEQLKVLDKRKGGDTISLNPTLTMNFAPSDYVDVGAVEKAQTPREKIETFKLALKAGAAIDAAIENTTKGIINPLNRDRLDKDLSTSYAANKATFEQAGKAWESGDEVDALLTGAKGVASLVAEYGDDALANPAASLEYIAENVPQLALGAFGKGGKALMAATNVGYGVDIYRKGLEDYQATNNGNLPSRAEAEEMLAWSLSAAAVEQVGDALTLSPLKGKLGKIMGGAVEKARAGKVVGALKEVGKVPVAGATGVMVEAPTEMYQTAVEENLSKLNTDFDWEQISKAGAIGGIVGGGLKGGVATAHQVGESVVNARAKMAEQNTTRRLQQEKARANKEVLDAAFETGNITALVDPKSEHYSPVLAANALFERTKREDLSAEDKTKQAEQAQQVVLGLEQRIKELEANKTKARPEDLANITGNIDRIKEALSKTDPAQNPDLHSQLTETLKAYEEERTALDVVDPETLAMREKEIESLKALLPDVRNMANAASASVASLSQPTPEDIAKDVELVNTPAAQAGEEHKAAAKRVITLAMEGDGISYDDIDALVNNPDNSLSAEERDFLGTVRDNRFAENNFKSREDVRMDVLEGSADGQFLGINQFRKRLSASIKSGNAAQAATHLQGIAAFAKERAGKAKAMVAAWKDFQRTGEKTQWVRDPSSPTGFVKADREYTREELAEAKGFEIYGRSARLIKSVQEEAALAAGAFKEMKAAYKLAFNTKPAQAPTVQQEQPEKPVTPAKATKPTPAATPAPVVKEEESSTQIEQDIINRAVYDATSANPLKEGDVPLSYGDALFILETALARA